MTFADFCSDFSDKVLGSCNMEVLSSFKTGALELVFPKLERERKERRGGVC
jgi:hypothetical protein